jgi:hypothetical protein
MRHQIESDDIANIMASFADDAGSLGRATRAVVALPERVDKDNSRLIWLPRGKVVPIDTRDLGDLVYRFLRLTDSDEAILEFARKFGPLWICRRHDVAAYHPPTLFMPGALGPGPTGNDDMGLKPVFDYNCLPEKLKDGRWAESLGTWRRFSLRAKSVLAIAARLKAGKDISKEEWRAVDGFDWDWEKWGAWAYLADPWSRLAETLNWWLVIAQAQPFVTAHNNSLRASIGIPRVSRHIPSVLSVIAVQLIFACQRQSDFVTCSGCGLVFLPKRRPVAGKQVGLYRARRNYCETCRGSVALRNAKADQMDRDRKIWSLAQQGNPVEKIARITKLDRARVEQRLRQIRARNGRIK